MTRHHQSASSAVRKRAFRTAQASARNDRYRILLIIQCLIQPSAESTVCPICSASEACGRYPVNGRGLRYQALLARNGEIRRAV